MKTIGIKLADGSFYPVLQEGTRDEKQLDLTTAHNNQTRVMVDMYRSKTSSIEDAEYVDTLQIDNLIAHPNGEPDISFTVSLDENNNLFAKIVDSETGAQSKTTITLVSRTLEERLVPDTYEIKESQTSEISIPDVVEDKMDSLENDSADKDENSNVKAGIVGAVAGAGLLAAAMNINKKLAENDSNETKDDNSAEKLTDVLNDSFENTTGDLIEENPVSEEFDVDVVEEDPAIAEISEETAIDESELMDDLNLDQDDLNLGQEDLNQNQDDFNFDLPEESFDDINIVTDESDENIAEDSVENFVESSSENNEIPAEEAENSVFDSEFISETPAENDELANFFDEIPEENVAAEEEPSEVSVFDEIDQISESIPQESLEVTDIFDMNDLDSDGFETEDENLLENSAIESDDIFADESVFAEENPVEDSFGDSLDDIPDIQNENTLNDDVFDFNDSQDITETSSEDDNIFDSFDSTDSLDSNSIDSLSDDDIFGSDDSELPDFSELDNISTDTSFEESDDSDIFNTDGLEDLSADNKSYPMADPFNFEGLSDTSYFDTDEKESKKVKIPVIICVICAIICVIATCLILFIIPSKYNLIGKDKDTEIHVYSEGENSELIEESVLDSTLLDESAEDEFTEDFDYNFEDEFVEEEIPEAKEDEIVVIEEAEKVVPAVPEVVEEKPADISYKIKWGDTLWDISDTYYKNPWLYKKIARYNNIKNPDYIISGTVIAIPAE